MLKRIPRKKPTYEHIDLTVPVNTKEIMANETPDSCFGKMWNVQTQECNMCCDSEICGVLFHHKHKKRVAKYEEENIPTLDRVDFDNVTDEDIRFFISLKQRTTQELFDFVTERSKCADEETVIQYIKNYIMKTPDVYTKHGRVLIRKKK